MKPNIDNYEQVLQFVGKRDEEYFLSFDPISKFKYVLDLPEGRQLTEQDLLEFEYKVLHHEIEPFFASEPVPTKDKYDEGQIA